MPAAATPEELAALGQELADRFNLNSAQVRKDLAYFGEFGVRGIGYYVSGLKAELQRILGLDREWMVRAIAATGNYGEIFSRNVGEKTPLALKRGLNAQWNKGGLQYAMPIR